MIEITTWRGKISEESTEDILSDEGIAQFSELIDVFVAYQDDDGSDWCKDNDLMQQFLNEILYE